MPLPLKLAVQRVPDFSTVRTMFSLLFSDANLLQPPIPTPDLSEVNKSIEVMTMPTDFIEPMLPSLRPSAAAAAIAASAVEAAPAIPASADPKRRRTSSSISVEGRKKGSSSSSSSVKRGFAALKSSGASASAARRMSRTLSHGDASAREDNSDDDDDEDGSSASSSDYSSSGESSSSDEEDEDAVSRRTVAFDRAQRQRAADSVSNTALRIEGGPGAVHRLQSMGELPDEVRTDRQFRA